MTVEEAKEALEIAKSEAKKGNVRGNRGFTIFAFEIAISVLDALLESEQTLNEQKELDKK